MRDYAAYVQVIQRVQSDLNYRKEVNNTGTFFDLKMMAIKNNASGGRIQKNDKMWRQTKQGNMYPKRHLSLV